MNQTNLKQSSLLSKFNQTQIQRWAAILLLCLLIIFGAIPNYITGKWSWQKVPNVANISQIRNLRQTGLTIPDWQSIKQEVVQIGSHEWSVQVLKNANQESVTLLLLPQKHHKAKPEVEWVDINGFESWKTDSFQSLNFQVEPENIKVKARFFRAWNPKQTFAVVQWYAFPHGGNYKPGSWFWSDQMAQLHRQRVPWVAVCLQIPIEPLGDINKVKSLAISLSQQIQARLISEVFTGK